MLFGISSEFSFSPILNRGRRGTTTVSRKIFSPRDSLPKLSPGNPRPANLSPGPSPRSQIFWFCVLVPVRGPDFSNFSPSLRSRMLWIWVPAFKMSPVPCSRFPGPGLRDTGDPIPDAAPDSKPSYIPDFFIYLRIKKILERKQINLFDHLSPCSYQTFDRCYCKYFSKTFHVFNWRFKSGHQFYIFPNNNKIIMSDLVCTCRGIFWWF